MNALLNLVMALLAPLLLTPPPTTPSPPPKLVMAKKAPPVVPKKAPPDGPPAAENATAAVAPVSLDSTAKVLAGIQAYYANAKDLKAKFTQRYTYKVYDRTQVSSGKVFFKKPRMMRWDYQKPVPKVFVADGETLWIYEPEENQVFKRDLKDSQLPLALTFMSGDGRLSEAFDATLVDGAADVFTLELVPKKSAAEYQKLILTVDRETYQVRESTVIDPVGNTNRVIFAELTTNTGLPDRGFRFTPPKEVRVITEPGR
jgi:outer membrane lipoprotein carrier protein